MEDLRCATELEVATSTYYEVHFLECQELLHLLKFGFWAGCLNLYIALMRLLTHFFALLISAVAYWLPTFLFDHAHQQPSTL